MLHKDAHFSATPAQVLQALAVIFRRDIQRQAADVDGVHMHGFAEQVPQRSLKSKLPDVEQWLYPGFPWIRIAGAINLQPFALDVQTLGDPDVQFVKLDAAFETCG